MAAKAGHIGIVKSLVENGPEVNAVRKVKVDICTISLTGFVLSSYCILLKTVYMHDNETDDSISILCLCWFLLGRFNSHVIKRVNYIQQGERVDVRNDATIIMYIGTQCHTLHLISLSSYFKTSNNVDRIME